MKKTFLTLLVVGLAGWLGAQGPIARVPTGAIATHFSGRSTVSAEGVVNIFGYFPVIDGIGSGLFSGDPEVKNAHFTFRSAQLRPTIAPAKGLVSFLTFSPVQGEAFYSVYYQAAPNRDFSRLESFSEGQLIGSFRARSASVTLMPHTASSFNATLILDPNSATDFTFRGRNFNLRNLVSSLTIHAVTEPFSNFEFGKESVTFGYGGVGIAAQDQ